jgi:kynurenine formamidase
MQTSRRDFIRNSVLASAGLVLLPRLPAFAQTPRFSRVIDLSHTIEVGGQPAFSMEPTRTYDKDKMNINRWTITEHGGTHIDAPLHFTANGASLESIPLSDLIAPLVLIDISRRAESNPDTAVMPDDIAAWEKANGALPAGCCVVMHSGWGKKFGTPAYGGRGADGKAHVPGFHVDTAKLLLTRDVKGIGVDTASIDQGGVSGFPAHNAWLPAGRWDLEGLNNLDQVPTKGATIVVGALKVKGATGGPARIMALV